MIERYRSNVTVIRVERASRRTEVRSLLMSCDWIDNARLERNFFLSVTTHILLSDDGLRKILNGEIGDRSYIPQKSRKF